MTTVPVLIEYVVIVIRIAEVKSKSLPAFFFVIEFHLFERAARSPKIQINLINILYLSRRWFEIVKK